MGILIFFSKIPPILKLEGGFFSTLKSFWNILSKYGELSLYKLIMTEVSRNLRNIFFTQNTPTFENWRWIFFQLKKFLKFFLKIRWIIFL